MAASPDRRDWERIAGQWQALLDRRIEALLLMRRKSVPASVVAVCRWSIAPSTTSRTGCRPGKRPRYLLGTSRRRMTG